MISKFGETLILDAKGHRFSKNANQKFEGFLPWKLLEGRAKILQIFGWHFGRNDDLVNSFRI